MWTTLAQNAALVLGLAISIFTIYTAVQKQVEQRRGRYAMMGRLRADAAYFISLAVALSSRAEQVKELYAPNPPVGFPSPAAERDSLPEGSQEAVQWLVARAEHLLAYSLPIDIEKAGSMLTRRQIDALLQFLTSFRRDMEILATRTFDLKMFPRKMGVLYRFAAVAWQVGGLKSLLDDFEASLELKPPASGAP